MQPFNYSLVLVLNWSNNSLELDVKLFNSESDMPSEVLSRELVQDLLQDCCILSKLLNETLQDKLLLLCNANRVLYGLFLLVLG